jgi:hypothetical protein
MAYKNLIINGSFKNGEASMEYCTVYVIRLGSFYEYFASGEGGKHERSLLFNKIL